MALSDDEGDYPQRDVDDRRGEQERSVQALSREKAIFPTKGRSGLLHSANVRADAVMKNKRKTSD